MAPASRVVFLRGSVSKWSGSCQWRSLQSILRELWNINLVLTTFFSIYLENINLIISVAASWFSRTIFDLAETLHLWVQNRRGILLIWMLLSWDVDTMNSCLALSRFLWSMSPEGKNFSFILRWIYLWWTYWKNWRGQSLWLQLHAELCVQWTRCCPPRKCHRRCCRWWRSHLIDD